MISNEALNIAPESVLGKIRTEIQRLRATIPGLGWQVKAGRYQVVDITRTNGRDSTEPLSEWLTGQEILAWLRAR